MNHFVSASVYLPPSAAYKRQWIGSALFQIMVCRLSGTKPLLLMGPLVTNFYFNQNKFSFTKMHLKISSAKRRPFCPEARLIKLAGSGTIYPMEYAPDFVVILCYSCITSPLIHSIYSPTFCWNISPVLGRPPDNKVHGANMWPSWGGQDSSGPHVGPMNLAIWDCPRCSEIILKDTGYIAWTKRQNHDVDVPRVVET